ncbi:MAG: YceI family protein, partial [Parvularculaceae bacterium]|nr:YceI family protein [Parvularculaceae bacterium]
VDLESVTFGSDWYENVVKSPAWFDVENHPEAVFTGSLRGWDGEGSGTIKGEITLKGITKPAEFIIQLNCDVMDPCPVDAVGFSGEIEINRRDFDMTEFRGLVGNRVKLQFSGALVTAGEKVASSSAP